MNTQNNQTYKQQQNTEEKKEQKQLNYTTVQYTDEELNYRKFLVNRLVTARDRRNENFTEFDDMDYATYYEGNKKAAESYIRPKKNKQDVRVVTGTTQEKTQTLLSALLNYNLEPNIEVYDKNDFPIRELGQNLEEMVKKSRKLEEYDDMRPFIYKEMLDQGDVFVEDLWKVEYRPTKELKANWNEGVKPGKIEWKTRLEKVTERAEVKLYSGLAVFLGNVKEYFIEHQPYIFTTEYIPYDEAKTIYSGWERWAYVPKTVSQLQSTTDEHVPYYDWSIQKTEDNFVEIVKYFDKPNNEMMILLNGVMMLPIKFPLTAISTSGEYPIVKAGGQPISKHFAYSKSVPAKTKVDQETLDEFIKLIVLKTRQSFQPTMAYSGKKRFSKDVFIPGKIHYDVDPETMKPLVDPTGVSQAEFNAFQFIKEIVDSKSVSPVFSGESPQGNQTATEIIEMKKQQMMKLGLTIWGILMLERKLTWLRIFNLKENYTNPVDQKVSSVTNKLESVYRRITTQTTLKDGQQGTKIIEFNPERAQNATPAEIRAEEEFLSEPGNPVEKTYMNPLMLKKLKAVFYINITPTEKDSTELNRVLFIQSVSDAMNLFGPQALNMEYIKQRWATLNKEDPEKFFVPGQQAMPQQGQQSQAQQTGGEVGRKLSQGVKMPSLKEMASQ